MLDERFGIPVVVKVDNEDGVLALVRAGKTLRPAAVKTELSASFTSWERIRSFVFPTPTTSFCLPAGPPLEKTMCKAYATDFAKING